MQLDEFTAKIQALVDEVAALTTQVGSMQSSLTAEITRLEALIASLKGLQGIDPALLDPIAATVQTAVDNLKATQAAVASAQAQLDAEQPAPPVQAAGA